MDKFLKTAAATHGLSAITVSFIPENSWPFTVYAHEKIGECGAGSGATIEDAFAKALADARARFPRVAA